MEDVTSWMNKPDKKVTKRRKQEKAIVYKVIADCYEANEALGGDPFWSEKLNDFSRGKPPKGFSCDGDVVKFKKTSMKLSAHDDLFEKTMALIDFIREKGKIFSDMDKENASLKMEEWSEMRREDGNWSTYSKNKKVREQLLSYYVQGLKKDMKLDKDQCANLKTVILEGIKDGRIGEANVIMQDNAIVQIEGLNRDSKTGMFMLDPSLRIRVKKSYAKIRKRAEFKKDEVYSASTSINDFATTMFK